MRRGVEVWWEGRSQEGGLYRHQKAGRFCRSAFLATRRTTKCISNATTDPHNRTRLERCSGESQIGRTAQKTAPGQVASSARTHPSPPPPATMATSTAHQPFPSRPYTSGLGRTAGQSTFTTTPYNAQTPFNAPQQQNPGYGASGAGGLGGGAGGAATTQQQREAQRLERERQERAERERKEAEERNVLEALSEEQREEVNEAVSPLHSPPKPLPPPYTDSQ